MGRSVLTIKELGRTRILADRRTLAIGSCRRTKIRSIRRFVNGLAAFSTSKMLVNPYRSACCRQNLETYLAELLNWPYSGHLLIGEAPGERGCARTGIPFTDERMLRSGSHPFLKSLRSAVLVSGSTAENTAGIVWNHLCNCLVLPAFWNAVPFHPRSATGANRMPSSAEVEVGHFFLKQLLSLLSPRWVIAVGRTAENSLLKIGMTNFQTVRHPSHGGKRGYIAGLNLAGIRMHDAADR
jgi:uracil-DNA glycosylase